MSKNYFLSGSVFATAIKCPGSLHFDVTANPFEKRNKGAKAGTEKHAEIENDLSLIERYLPASWNIAEMQKAKTLLPEIQLSGKYKTLTLGGKADLIAFDHKTLYVYDWKTGYQDVSDMDPEQLVFYAYVFLMNAKPAIRAGLTNVNVRYVNPDSNTSSAYLFKTAELIKTVEKHFEKILKDLEKPDQKALFAGMHCRYCKAQIVCPRLRKQLLGYANPKFRDVRTEDWTDEEIGLLPVAESIIKKVKDDIKTRIDAGLMQSGFEVTRAAGTRSFIYGVDAVEVAKRLQTDPIAVQKSDLLSPAELEKDFDINCLSDLIAQPPRRILKPVKREVEPKRGKASKKSKKAVKKQS